MKLVKNPIYSPETEKAVISQIVNELDAFSKISSIIESKYFYDSFNRAVFDACSELFHNSEGIDIVTISNKLRSFKRSDYNNIEICDPAKMVQLSMITNSSVHITYHAVILKDYWIRRESVLVLDKFSSLMAKKDNDSIDLINELSGVFNVILKDGDTSNSKSLKDYFLEVLQNQQNRLDNKPSTSSILIRNKAIRNDADSWHRTDLIIMAARPGMGKTAVILDEIIEQCLNGVPCFLASLEMGTVQLVMRIIAKAFNTSFSRIKDLKLTQSELNDIIDSSDKLKMVFEFLTINDKAGISIYQLHSFLSSWCKLWRDQGIDPGLVAIDYVQLMKGEKGGNREQEIASIARGLKELAKNMNVPIIALAQLSRAVELRGGEKIPILSDLRESGALEQDADVIIFLYRPEYYGVLEDENGESNTYKRLTRIFYVFAKNRNGSLFTSKGWSDLSRMKVYESTAGYDSFNNQSFNDDEYRSLSLPDSKEFKI